MPFLWAVTAVAVAYLLRILLDDFLKDGIPYLLFLLAVFVSAYFGSWRAGALAAFFSAPLGFYFSRGNSFSTTDWNGLALFLVASITLIYLIGMVSTRDRAVRAARRRSVTLARELDLLIDSAIQYAICLLDPRGNVVIWNAGAERLFGWTEREAVGQPHSLFFTDEDREQEEPGRELAEARSRGETERRGWRVRKDGSRFLAEAVLSRINDENGQLLGFGKVVRDITEEQAHAQTIEARETHLRSILSTVPDAMIVIDDRGIVQSFSAAAAAMFGYDEAEVVGRNVSMLMPSPDREQHDDYIARYRLTGQKQIIGKTRRVIGRRKDGSTFPHELAVGEASGGGQRLFTGFLRDITAREAAEEQLRYLQAELIHISRVSAMGTMASTLAHELNQPLTAIANYVQTSAALLADPESNTHELVREALHESGQEALRAGAIVQRLREFVSRGDLQRAIEPVERLVENGCTLSTVGVHAKGVIFSVLLDENPGNVLVDPVQIQQVLLNLIRNALESLPDNGEGRVELSVRRDGDMMRFTVTDNGSGIDAAIAESLFEAFASTKTEGMGLGLSICRTIVEAHGGRIWAESPQKGGTAFHFTVPRVDKEQPHE
tara:strand:- start:19467 stop:21287 length:1821 start_codon:yes stop_codon:yes gene_type:complete